MRDLYHEQLDAISDRLVEMTRLVSSAMSRATTALLDADLKLAESVIEGDVAVDEVQRALEDSALQLMARQQPVAGDLRTIVASLRMSADLERMGDLSAHIARVARRRYPASVVPPELRSTILQMGHVAERIVTKAGSVIARKDAEVALELPHDDDEMDKLHRELYRTILSPDWKYGVGTAVDVSLCGRYYERYADHAVSAANQVVFLVTGDWAAGEAEPAGERSG